MANGQLQLAEGVVAAIERACQPFERVFVDAPDRDLDC
jgi:hypothetical protein